MAQDASIVRIIEIIKHIVTVQMFGDVLTLKGTNNTDDCTKDEH